MNIIKTYKKDRYTLEHCTYIDDMGMNRNFIQYYYIETDGKDKGIRFNIPLHPPMRISNMKLTDGYIGDDTSPYTDKEYDEMITRATKYIKQQ